MFGRKLVGRIPRAIAVWGRRTTVSSSNLPPHRPPPSNEQETGPSTHFPAVVPAFFPYFVHSLEAAIAFQFANEGFVPAVRTAADQPPVDLSRVFFAPTWKVLRRDLNGLKLLASLKWRMRRAFRRNQPLSFYFLYWVHTTPNKQCVVEVETGRSFTFKELNELSNKYANYFRERGLQRGDVVALFMENSADFFALWLGLSKLGVVTAWINTHLKQEPLAHSLHTAHTHTIVTTAQLLPSLLTTIDEGLLPKESTEILTVGPNDHSFPDLSVEAQDTSGPPIPKALNFESTLCYIYTSGTTGNPKAAIVKHFRFHFMTLASGSAFGIRGTDRIYITMPLYHSAAGIIGIGQTIVRGSTAILRRSFSATEFWSDAIKTDATAAQYIGELCRYLLAQPKKDEERRHRIRLMYGNGLRPEIWAEFVERFGIKKIGEFYGSTEGNSNMVNIDSHIGSCGFIPTYPGVHKFYPLRLLKASSLELMNELRCLQVDPETNELCREANGLCIPCKPGDSGEVVGVIKQRAQTSFEGYLDQTESDKKIIRNVFKPGDAVFSSGDILLWDHDGRLYFKDRRGDTYRWRGENVSTMEVEGVLQPVMSIQDATVYGVEVRGREGRAGMIGATLVEGGDLNETLEELADRLPEHLPAYAVPLFLRICKQVDRTGTFKLKKADLQKQAFDPAACNGDLLFYWNADERKYLPLDREQFDAIQSGVYTRI